MSGIWGPLCVGGCGTPGAHRHGYASTTELTPQPTTAGQPRETGVTDADREVATQAVEQLVGYSRDMFTDEQWADFHEWPWVERIAAAIAAERDRVLAPVLAVCAELDGELDEYGYAIRNGLKPSPADRIRAAAGVPQPDGQGGGR